MFFPVGVLLPLNRGDRMSPLCKCQRRLISQTSCDITGILKVYTRCTHFWIVPFTEIVAVGAFMSYKPKVRVIAPKRENFAWTMMHTALCPFKSVELELFVDFITPFSHHISQNQLRSIGLQLDLPIQCKPFPVKPSIQTHEKVATTELNTHILWLWQSSQAGSTISVNLSGRNGSRGSRG